jgi:hypothetical protein
MIRQRLTEVLAAAAIACRSADDPIELVIGCATYARAGLVLEAVDARTLLPFRDRVRVTVSRRGENTTYPAPIAIMPGQWVATFTYGVYDLLVEHPRYEPWSTGGVLVRAASDSAAGCGHPAETVLLTAQLLPR